MAPPKCLDCAYYGGPKQYGFGLTCKAYPRGIPEEILEGKIDHDKPYPGDHGIQFKSKKERKRRRKLPKRKPKEGFHVLSVRREIWAYTNPARIVFFEDGLVSEVDQAEH